MAWTEARSGATTTARRVAHEDRAKDRRDEGSLRGGPRVRPRWLWPAAAGVLLVLVAGTGAAALVASRADKPARQAGPGTSPSAGGPESAAPTTEAPLAGGFTVAGAVTSTSGIGTRWAFPLTVRLACTDACVVTVTKVPGQYSIPARAFVQRTFAPAGGGTYRFELDEPLTRSGSEVLPGCEALRVRGSGTLVRDGDTITITTQHGSDQFAKPNGDRCSLVDREFVFTGTLS